VNYWYAWAAELAAAVATYVCGRNSLVGRRIIDGLKIHSPIIGKLFREIIISRSILTLGTMVENGVAMLEALRLTADVSGNLYYRRAWLHVVDEVINGRQICDSLGNNPLFPKR
jgi:type II secretory pathway component PulF